MILAQQGKSIRWRWQWCLGVCLASAILFLSGCAKTVHVVGLTQADATTAIKGAKLAVGTVTQQNSLTVPPRDFDVRP